MKKIIFSTAIVLMLFGTAFANRPGSDTRNAVASFQKDFKSASDVSWAESNRYILATFRLDKQTLYAYYDFRGNLLCLVHHLLTTGLPDDLQKEIKADYSSYWVTELVKVNTEDGEYYFIQLNNADESIILSTEGASGWHRYSRLKKNTDNF